MSRGNGNLIGNLIVPGAPALVPPQVVVAQPVNDAQLVAVMAAQLYDPLYPEASSPRAAVALALELIAEAVVQGSDLAPLIQAKRRQRYEPPEG